MKIIVLYGNNNTGKTTTLGMVYAALISNGAAEFTFSAVYDKGHTSDFETILGYKGKQIAICSYGDIPINPKNEKADNATAEKAKDYFEQVAFYKKEEVDVLIVAYSPKNDVNEINPPEHAKRILLKKTVENYPSFSEDSTNNSSKEYNTVSKVEAGYITRVQANAIDCHKIISLI